MTVCEQLIKLPFCAKSAEVPPVLNGHYAVAYVRYLARYQHPYLQIPASPTLPMADDAFLDYTLQCQIGSAESTYRVG